MGNMIILCTILPVAANSLQSCLTLCDPIDGSPPGSAIPGILQARTLEWVAISFSNYIAYFCINLNYPGGSDGKRICLQCSRPRFNPWVGKIIWRRKWQSTPVFLPGVSHGQRSLSGLQSTGSQRVRHD